MTPPPPSAPPPAPPPSPPPDEPRPGAGDPGMDLVQVMVQVARPAPESLADSQRGEKYRALRENSLRQRERLVSWIAAEGLEDEVSRVGPPTAFDLLFVDCTTRVARRLPEAPGVIKVSQVTTFGVSLGRKTRGDDPGRDQDRDTKDASG